MCLQNSKIENPNYGITSFDTIFASFLTVFRVAGRDYWEEVLLNLIATVGPWTIITFIFVIVYCSYQLMSLIWGHIAASYKYLDDERWENELLKDVNEVNCVQRISCEKCHSFNALNTHFSEPMMHRLKKVTEVCIVFIAYIA